jgi:drug/metabolite transporter (DMT)-like permease
MLAGAFVFSLMGTCAHALRDDCDWQAIAVARTGLALTFAAVLAKAGGVRLVFLRPGVLWVRSLAGSLSLVGVFFAFTRMPVGDVLTLTNVFPVWVALLSWPLDGVRPSLEVWLAIACGLTGVALIGQPHWSQQNWAALVALGCSLSTAVAMLGLHRLQGIDARAIVVHFSAVSLVFALAALWVFPRSAGLAHLGDPRAVLLLLGVGLTATIGQIALTKAFAAGPPAKVSVVGLTQVGFGILLDVVVWQRALDAVRLLGVAMVIAPTAWLLLRQGWQQADEL